jgi:hypothetical protein
MGSGGESGIGPHIRTRDDGGLRLGGARGWRRFERNGSSASRPSPGRFSVAAPHQSGATLSIASALAHSIQRLRLYARCHSPRRRGRRRFAGRPPATGSAHTRPDPTMKESTWLWQFAAPKRPPSRGPAGTRSANGTEDAWVIEAEPPGVKRGDGVLTVRVPKPEGSRPRQIQVTGE